MRILRTAVLVVLFFTGAAAPASAQQTPRLADARSGQAIPQIFDQYCKAASQHAAYCPGETLPDAIKWLVLASECERNPNAAAYCGDFLEFHAREAPLILEYDHERGRWSAMNVPDGRGQPREPGAAWRVSSDINGVPTITRGDPVPVIVSHTNPLLYGYRLEATKLGDVEGLADLKSVATGLGGFLQSWVTVAAGRKAPQGLPATGRSAKTAMPAVDPLTAALAHTRLVLADLVRDTWELDTGVDRAAADVSAAIARASDVERSRAAGLAVRAARHNAAPPAAGLLASFDKVEAGLTALQRFGGSCRPLLYAFALLGPMKPGDAAVADAKERYQALDREIGPSCDGIADQSEREMVDDLRTLLGALVSNINVSSNGFATAQTASEVVVAMFQPDDKAGKETMSRATQLLGKRGDAEKIVTRLGVARAREDRFTLPDGRVLTWFYVERRSEELPWDKLQTHGFTIAADSVYADAVERTRPTGTKAEYRVRPRWTRGFGVGIGLSYTHLAEPVWDALPASPGSATKVITQTGSQTRAGRVVLFLDYDWLALCRRSRPLPVGLITQIGTSVSSSPGLFLGTGAELWRVARLTGGWTWQRVPELTNGQYVGKPVGSKDEIQTRDAFKGDWYIALTFALDWLPVFGR